MGKIFVTASPSAGGKTTLNRRLLELRPNLHFSVSYTTRKPRLGDKEGVDYFFINEEDFKKKIEAGDFIEYALVHNKYYGTCYSQMKKLLQKGDVLLEIDVQGARQIKTKFPESVLIFILPPNMKVLKERLIARKTENEKQISLRLEAAKKELEEISKYDYIVINDELQRAVNDMVSIIISEGLKVSSNNELIDNFKSQTL